MDHNELRSSLPGTALWAALGLPDGDRVAKLNGGSSEVKIKSPFRADQSPSFSVTLSKNDGSLICTDWSTNETWNDWDLIARGKGVDPG